MRGRLFERLEQRVERRFRHHVDFVDDVDLVACGHRSIAHRVGHRADVVDPVVRGGVHFDHVDMAALGDRPARLAHPARINGRPALAISADAVQRLGDQPRGAGLADPAHAGHQKRMRQPLAPDRIAQRANHRFLADQLGECLRTVFARENAIGLPRIDLGQRLRRHIEAETGRLSLVRRFVAEDVGGIAHGAQVRCSGGDCRSMKRSRATRRKPLWLLPSGPDQVGGRKRPPDSRWRIWRRVRELARSCG